MDYKLEDISGETITLTDAKGIKDISYFFMQYLSMGHTLGR
ncbi:hypothetical protein Ct9H90mP29_12660 [bacterium]|nr:MAG: hypothetical protein Ct9H90mP29_12660 [bacterium]